MFHSKPVLSLRRATSALVWIAALIFFARLATEWVDDPHWLAGRLESVHPLSDQERSVVQIRTPSSEAASLAILHHASGEYPKLHGWYVVRGKPIDLEEAAFDGILDVHSQFLLPGSSWLLNGKAWERLPVENLDAAILAPFGAVVVLISGWLARLLGALTTGGALWLAAWHGAVGCIQEGWWSVEPTGLAGVSLLAFGLGASLGWQSGLFSGSLQRIVGFVLLAGFAPAIIQQFNLPDLPRPLVGMPAVLSPQLAIAIAGVQAFCQATQASTATTWMVAAVAVVAVHFLSRGRWLPDLRIVHRKPGSKAQPAAPVGQPHRG